MAEILAGVIERVTFHNPENGFAVLRVQAEGRPELVTLVGQMPSALAGEYIEATGAWINDLPLTPERVYFATHNGKNGKR